MQCNHCGRRTRFDSIQYQYEKRTRKPLYLFSGLFLMSCYLVYGLVRTPTEPAAPPASVAPTAVAATPPEEGDIYAVSKEIGDATSYYFIKIVMIKGDSLYTLHSNRLYDSRKLKTNDEDHFVEGDVMIIQQHKLLQGIKAGNITLITDN